MPHANIWIRKQQWDRWQSLPNKSEWLNQQLEQIKVLPSMPNITTADKITYEPME